MFVSVALIVFEGGGGGGFLLPINGVMGMCRWMGWHSHDWIDYNGVVFSTEFPTELLEWGGKLWAFLGKKILASGIFKWKNSRLKKK